MAYFGNISRSSPTNSYDDGTLSPDEHFAIKVTHRSVLPEGVTEGTIWLFDVADVVKSVEDHEATPSAPAALVRMSAAINGYPNDYQDWNNVLLHPRWSDDGKRIFFLGRDGQENRQLFVVDIASAAVTALSPENRDVFAYAVAGQHVAFLVGSNIDTDELWRSAGADIPDIVSGTGTPLIPLLFPNLIVYPNTAPVQLELWRVREGVSEPVVDASSGNVLHIAAPFDAIDLSISPAGAQAVTVVVDSTDPDDRSTVRAYRIIDLQAGSFRDTHDLEAADLDWIPFARRELNPSNGLRLQVAESLNQRPVLVATVGENGDSRTIFDPNPQLADVLLAPVNVFEWEDTHGRTHVGGLIKPLDFNTDRQYPLVIQTHGFSETRFYRSGPSETANAGRALASRDIVILQVEEPGIGNERPIDLDRVGLDVYLSAIDELAASGMVHAEKVGISGYSFTGITVASSISRAPKRFAAAVIANADPLTMTGYFSYVDSPLHGVPEESFVGTWPFADGLQAWIEKSPSMSTHLITAPLLISATDPMHLLSLWDLYSALRYQGKAVDLQYIRSGAHNIRKPLHRLAHQEMIVDWFDFWLNDHEDADPAKVEQYRRWRELDRAAQ